MAGTKDPLTANNDSRTGGGVSESSTNTAKRDTNFSGFDTNKRQRPAMRRDERERRTIRQSRAEHPCVAMSDANTVQTSILQWARSPRDVIAERDRNSTLAERDDSIAQLTTGVAAHETNTKEARIGTMVSRDSKPSRATPTSSASFRMSRAMRLERNGSKLILVPANSDIDNERLV